MFCMKYLVFCFFFPVCLGVVLLMLINTLLVGHVDIIENQK